MSTNFKIGRILVLIGLIFFSTAVKNNATDAPPNMAAGLIMQLLTLEKTLTSAEGDLTIHVIGNKQLAEELKRSIGQTIAKRKLVKVTSSDGLPTETTNILVVAKEDFVSKAIEYSRTNKIISITNNPDLVVKGVTLGIGMNETGGQLVTINMDSSKLEGLDWKPTIMKIAKAVK